MDCRLQAHLRTVVERLGKEHQQELAAAGTLIDLEDLACQIGDELTRQLTESELIRRGQEHGLQQVECPDCGRLCPAGEPEPVVLEGLRGELAYSQPKHFCDRCRRSFFPAGGSTGSAPAEHGDAESA